jgi:hypothetical protein
MSNILVDFYDVYSSQSYVVPVLMSSLVNGSHTEQAYSATIMIKQLFA